MTIKVMPGLDGSGPWVMFEGAGMMAILNRARKVLLLWAQVHPVMWRVSLKALAGMVKLTPALSAVVLNAYSAYSKTTCLGWMRKDKDLKMVGGGARF